MFTIILALINSKYQSNYEGIFVGTVILDLALMAMIYSLLIQHWH